MRASLYVPSTHLPLARKRNFARPGFSLTTLIVAKRVGVSTPFSGSRGALVGAAVVADMVCLLFDDRDCGGSSLESTACPMGNGHAATPADSSQCFQQDAGSA
jgi:hypothetical protein